LKTLVSIAHGLTRFWQFHEKIIYFSQKFILRHLEPQKAVFFVLTFRVDSVYRLVDNFIDLSTSVQVDKLL